MIIVKAGLVETHSVPGCSLSRTGKGVKSADSLLLLPIANACARVGKNVGQTVRS